MTADLHHALGHYRQFLSQKHVVNVRVHDALPRVR